MSFRAAASRGEWVCDLVPPGEGVAVVSVAFAGGFDERDPGVVDGEGVRAQRPGCLGGRGEASSWLGEGAGCLCRVGAMSR